MSNEDKRRRRDGSTTQLSVADLIARREAETQPIPIIRIDDTEPEPEAEDTVRFAPVRSTSLSGRELHVAELLRREGRPADEERGGGLSMSRLVALASGGVVLCGSVAFGASQWLSSPDERPLADVRFDTRPAARATNAQGQIALNAPGVQPQTPTSTTDPTTQTQVAQQPVGKRSAPAPQQPDTGSPTVDPTVDPTTPPSSESTTTPPPPPPVDTTTPPPNPTPPPVDSVPPTTSTTPPPSSAQPPSSTPAPAPSTGLGIRLDLGKVIEPLGGFDFFAA